MILTKKELFFTKDTNFFTLPEIDFKGVCLRKDSVKISYDRTGNILIGMDLLSQMDVHIGKSKILGKTIFLACPYDSMNSEYLKTLNKHFDLQDT